MEIESFLERVSAGVYEEEENKKPVWYVDADIDLPDGRSFGVSWKHKGMSYDPKDYKMGIILEYKDDNNLGVNVDISELNKELKANGFPDIFLDMLLENVLKDYQADHPDS